MGKLKQKKFLMPKPLKFVQVEKAKLTKSEELKPTKDGSPSKKEIPRGLSAFSYEMFKVDIKKENFPAVENILVTLRNDLKKYKTGSKGHSH